MPPAARVTDMHTCPMFDGPKPHVGGPVLPAGCPTVLIGNLPAARVGDMATCASAPDVIVKGSPTVLIGGMMAARMGDQTAHGGVIVIGFPTVIIGESGSGGGGGGGAEQSGAGESHKPDDVKASGMQAMAAAFSSAAKSATALVCKGPCTACGQA